MEDKASSSRLGSRSRKADKDVSSSGSSAASAAAQHSKCNSVCAVSKGGL